MKYCKHCGTEVSDESTVCKNCNASLKEKTDDKVSKQNLSKKFNKMMIVMPLVVILTAAVTFALTYFLLPQRIADTIGASSSAYAESEQTSGSEEVRTVASNNSVSKCQLDEYGNHDWEPANCVEPAKCRRCGEYKDNILVGNHNWWPATCVEPAECQNCGEYKDDKLGSHYYLEDGRCRYCGTSQ